VDGATQDAWLYFPCIKVGPNLTSFLTIFGGVDYKSLRIYGGMFIPELGG
jgi:hypothetical protein